MFAKLLLRLLLPTMLREPDFIVGGKRAPYLLRWFVIPRNSLFNVYLHEFLRSDDDRALHDHPYLFNISIMLRGHYTEHTARKAWPWSKRVPVATERRAGSIHLRLGPAPHRLELVPGTSCVTVFITGPRYRNWGFHCAKGWVPWQIFTAKGDAGDIGAGCGDKK